MHKQEPKQKIAHLEQRDISMVTTFNQTMAKMWQDALESTEAFRRSQSEK